MQDLITYAVIAVIAYQLIKAGALRHLLAFIGLVKRSQRAMGKRQTAHAVVDGLFDASKHVGSAFGERAKSVAGSVAGRAGQAGARAQQAAATLRPQDYRFDDQTGELTIMVNANHDLVLGRNKDGSSYALLVDNVGNESELGLKKLERYIAHAAQRKQLSQSQLRAIRDFMRQGK